MTSARMTSARRTSARRTSARPDKLPQDKSPQLSDSIKKGLALVLLDILQLSVVTVGRSYSCLRLQLSDVTVVPTLCPRGTQTPPK